ncbi:multiple sugar transport system substrate-binding protein [Amphibacillus marinus]|uniref:Multiple sugar transport system substrate-binding protein n=1 Tax=Amphibacillus marinus TaxID=872970 RepID=A0A1H8QC08_9BACI|nr:sugar ABC transporter substrate-binding protein [Amphibacillus marinus]SEO51742.1 multiple sugar transport system substrate-binding protein [Amphibacillus marinus]
MKLKGLALCLLTLMVITACGTTNSGNNENEFIFATWAAGEELQEFEEIINQVNENADGEYTVKALSIPSDYYIKLATQISSNNAPDFFWMTQELISRYANLGAITDLTEKLEQSEQLTPDLFYDGVLASATYEDRYYGVPWIANPLMIYYNKDLFDQEGIDHPSPTDPWTWDEFIEVAKELTVIKQDGNGNDYQQFGTVVDGWPNIETFMWAGGGDIIAEDGEDILIDSAESLEGLSILNEILTSGITPSYAQVSSLGSNNVWFEKQRAAMFMGGIQDNFEEKMTRWEEEEQFEIGYTPMPVGQDGEAYAFNWTASTVMSIDQAENPLAYQALEDITLEFFKWKVASPLEGQVERVVEIDPHKEEALETIEQSLLIARSANYIPEWDVINNRLWVDLYTGMLNAPESFDYEAMAKEIADFARNEINKR